MNTARISVVAIVSLALLSGCGSDTVKAQLRVGQLRGAQNPLALVTATDLPVSQNEFGFVALDGIRLGLKRLEFRDPVSDNSSIANLEGDTLEMGPESVTFSLEREISIAPGSYYETVLEFDESVEYKGLCRTRDYLLYTSASGIERIDCSTADCNNPTLTDYDYTRYEFLSAGTALGPLDLTDSNGEFTYSDFSVAGDTEAVDENGEPLGVSVIIAVLVDTSFLVTCYDGSGTLTQDAFDGSLSPFNGSTDHGSLSDFFPNDQPNFGMFKMNMTVWSTQDATEALPIAETYISSPDPDLLEGINADLNQVQFTTMVFEEDGTLHEATTRTLGPVSAVGEFLQQWPTHTVDTSGSYTLGNGGVQGQESGPNVVSVDRTVSGFERLGFNDPPFMTEVGNGPNCGDGNPRFDPRDCLGTPESVYWKRVQRADEL